MKKPEKNSGIQSGLNAWPRDTGAMLYQLSYEVTTNGKAPYSNGSISEYASY